MAETPNTTPNQTLYATLEKVGQLLLKFLKILGRGVWRIRRKVYRFLMLKFYKYRYNIPEPFRRRHTLII
ncbi:MAG: hypothetical protein AAGG68_27215 [Bacteroidota bacterium]